MSNKIRLAEGLKGITSFLALPFESTFTPDSTVQFAKENWAVAIGCVVAYLIFITVGRQIMDKRDEFDLTLPLAAWNAFLCLFSFLGMCRTVPYLLGSLLEHKYHETVCTNPTLTWGKGPTGFWVMLFIFSKIPELIDTVFIVLRKKRLLFLHWYHHVSVLLFCWSAYSTMAGSGLYFVAMNYTVHAMMYGYYCLQALKLCPKSFPAILITLSQIFQMFAGTGVCISCWYFKLFPPSNSVSECYNQNENLYAGAFMYASYLYLFIEFAVRRYFGGNKKSQKKKLA